MKAAIYHTYGPPDVLSIREVEKPTPKADQVLIKVHYSSVTSGDCRLRGLKSPPGFGLLMRLAIGWNGPRQPITGYELAGEIEAVGADVTRYKVGDRVFGSAGASGGANAEYVCRPEKATLAHIPDDMNYEDMVSVAFGADTALFYLRDLAKIQPGENVLIIGASGAVGSYAVQLAKYYGAEVTGVCSARNVELVQSLGADHVIDYTQQDALASGVQYDVIMDCVGGMTLARAKPALKPQGRLLLVVAGLPQFLTVLRTRLFGQQKVLAGVAPGKRDDLEFLKSLLVEGAIRSVVDRCFPLSEIVEAHRYVDSGRKRGNVILQVVDDDAPCTDTASAG